MKIILFISLVGASAGAENLCAELFAQQSLFMNLQASEPTRAPPAPYLGSVIAKPKLAKPLLHFIFSNESELRQFKRQKATYLKYIADAKDFIDRRNRARGEFEREIAEFEKKLDEKNDRINSVVIRAEIENLRRAIDDINRATTHAELDEQLTITVQQRTWLISEYRANVSNLLTKAKEVLEKFRDEERFIAEEKFERAINRATEKIWDIHSLDSIFQMFSDKVSTYLQRRELKGKEFYGHFQFETDRVVARLMSPIDIDDVSRIIDDEDVYSSFSLNRSRINNGYALSGLVENLSPENQATYTLVDKISNEIVGVVFLTESARTFAFSAQPDGLVIGYVLNKKYWNSGIMTGVVQSAKNFAGACLGIKNLYAQVFTDNIGSLRVLEKNNFKIFLKNTNFFYLSSSIRGEK